MTMESFILVVIFTVVWPILFVIGPLRSPCKYYSMDTSSGPSRVGVALIFSTHRHFPFLLFSYLYSIRPRSCGTAPDNTLFRILVLVSASAKRAGTIVGRYVSAYIVSISKPPLFLWRHESRIFHVGLKFN